MRDYKQTIRELRDPQYVYHYSRDYLKNMMDDAADVIEELLPLAQIEPLTDNEQRIFLAAMRREEKVCKQVNEEYEGREGPFEVDLVRICHEITRKVKGGTMEELISRQAAIEAINRAVTKEVARWSVKELPSAQPETAKRIVGKSRGGMTLWYQCDMCNEPVDAQDDFCRGCGRRLTDG